MAECSGNSHAIVYTDVARDYKFKATTLLRLYPGYTNQTCKPKAIDSYEPGDMDSFPILSQCKSAVQAICGDTEGARKTQENFLKTCPVVSQGTSAVQAMMGDTEGAKETQLQFVEFLSDTADAVPGVGHVKGGIHYACGDTEGGNKAMKSSSRTTGVIGGGVLGFVAGGPAGAAAGGVAGGLAMDSLTTGIDSVAHDGEFRPSGTIAAIDNIVQGKSESVSGAVFDVVVGTVMDGMTGIAAGEQVGRMSKVKVEGEGQVASRVPADKQSHVPGAMEKVKGLTGDELRNIKGEALAHEQAKHNITQGSNNLSRNQRNQQVRQLNRNRPMHTDHNIHGLIEDHQGQIAVDLKPKPPVGSRCAERFVMEDPKRNYTVNVVEYLDDHNYGRITPKPGPGPVTRAANFIADHQAVYGAAAGVYPAAAGGKGVATFDFLVIGASAGGIACANRAAELGKRVALVGSGDKDSVSVSFTIVCVTVVVHVTVCTFILTQCATILMLRSLVGFSTCQTIKPLVHM